MATARHMVGQALWENAYFADLRMCVSASEAGFQLLSGFLSTIPPCRMACHAPMAHALIISVKIYI